MGLLSIALIALQRIISARATINHDFFQVFILYPNAEVPKLKAKLCTRKTTARKIIKKNELYT